LAKPAADVETDVADGRTIRYIRYAEGHPMPTVLNHRLGLKAETRSPAVEVKAQAGD